MPAHDRIPDDLTLVRTTNVFDNDNVPKGLLRAHKIAAGRWGRLVVRRGSVRFVFEDEPGDAFIVDEGEHVVIPPERLHHVAFEEPGAFVVEFYAADASDPPSEGRN